jgi:hypothetical protein
MIRYINNPLTIFSFSSFAAVICEKQRSLNASFIICFITAVILSNEFHCTDDPPPQTQSILCLHC